MCQAVPQTKYISFQLYYLVRYISERNRVTVLRKNINSDYMI